MHEGTLSFAADQYLSESEHPGVGLCEHCPDPGKCCRGFGLYPEYLVPKFKDGIEKAMEFLESGKWSEGKAFPFYPLEPLYDPQEYPDTPWKYSCVRLSAEGRCIDYGRRPRLCRTYTPGPGDPLCVYYRPEEAPSLQVEEDQGLFDEVWPTYGIVSEANAILKDWEKAHGY